jgi:hypothetical protein
LLSAFDLPCAEGHGLADVAHTHYCILVDSHGEAFFTAAKLPHYCPVINIITHNASVIDG